MLKKIQEVEEIIDSLTAQIEKEIKTFPEMGSSDIYKATQTKNILLDNYFKKYEELKVNIQNLSKEEEEIMELIDQSMVLLEEKIIKMLKENKKLFSITKKSMESFQDIIEASPKIKIRPV